MKRVDSQALGLTNVALGLTGAGAAETEYVDGQLEQSFNVTPVVRRSRTQAGTEGLYYGLLSNVHTAAGQLSTNVDPFNVSTGRLSPYPSVPGPWPPGFDLWILSATVLNTAGGGTVEALLNLLWEPTAQAWGLNNSAAAITGNNVQPLAHWDTLTTVTGYAVLSGDRGVRATFGNNGVRLRRGTVGGNSRIQFVSKSNGSATFQCTVVLGVFPVALGQDGVG